MASHLRDARGRSNRVALVPTMGDLHEGHLSLVRIARERSDFVVVSIFVNPTQFGPGEDFDRYPRAPDRDLALCRTANVDAVFAPDSGEMYAPDHSVFVEETSLAVPLCGMSRPAHFRGVTTVVAKLFNIVGPDMAVFGLKDAQQARIIEQMVRDLNFPVEIVLAPIVREPDGLAMSSRNRYLSAAQRRLAPGIHAALEEARAAFDAGERNARSLRTRVRARLESVSAFDVEYAETVAWQTLRPVDMITETTLLAVAVRLGSTRLIDNVRLTIPG
jgi:pantoate--beta-alanine ligase